jgi:flagellin
MGGRPDGMGEKYKNIKEEFTMRIANNISALNTHRVLTNSDSALSKSMERLSSGFRINRAADDAAGLAISEKMRAQIRGLNQASSNAQNGISMIQTAEGGLNETHSILQRMRELALQAKNGTLTEADKKENQKEIDQLISEVNRISTDTEFNTKKLLNGDAGVKSSAQNGVATNTVKVNGTSYTNASVSSTDLQHDISVSAGSNTQTGVYAVNVTKTAESAKLSGAQAFGDDGTAGNLGTAGTLTINGVSVDFTTSDSLSTAITKINNVTGKSGVVASANGNQLVLATQDKGSDVTISIQGAGALVQDLGLATGATTTALTDAGADAEGTIGGALATGKGNTLTSVSGNSKDLSITIDDNTDLGTNGTLAFDAAVDPNGEVTLQIGANAGQEITFSIGDMSAKALSIDDLDVTNNASLAVTKLDAAIEKVSSERSNMGAIQNRLDHTISNLGVASENLSASESRIRDVDMAAEMATFTKNQILVQAATAMLAQANQKSQSVLKLLG